MRKSHFEASVDGVSLSTSRSHKRLIIASWRDKRQEKGIGESAQPGRSPNAC